MQNNTHTHTSTDAQTRTMLQTQNTYFSLYDNDRILLCLSLPEIALENVRQALPEYLTEVFVLH